MPSLPRDRQGGAPTPLYLSSVIVAVVNATVQMTADPVPISIRDRVSYARLAPALAAAYMLASARQSTLSLAEKEKPKQIIGESIGVGPKSEFLDMIRAKLISKCDVLGATCSREIHTFHI